MVKSVYIGNLPFDTTEDELRAVFGAVGSVLSVNVVRDPESGQCRGYAFCKYRDVATAQLAVDSLDGIEFNGRELRVSMGRERQN
jgi:cleavage stimulation factor subunit 2